MPKPTMRRFRHGIAEADRTERVAVASCLRPVFSASEFPAIHPCLALYVSVTNGRGTVPFKVQLVDVNEEQDTIWVEENEFEFPDPRVVLEMCFYLHNLTFTEPGAYRFQLFARNKFLMERRILVIPPMPGQISREGDDQ